MPARYVIRYGAMRHLGEFSTRDADFARGAQVIVRSHRGTEWGEVLCFATDRTREYLGSQDASGKVLRSATPDDERLRNDLVRREQDSFLGGREEISQRNMAMQLVDVELLFGLEKLIFYYTADGRVDFRELVKALAKRFQSRIEMRQIGIRDEAKLLADYGDCGKPVCCNTFLQQMPPVSMKMAKLQKATLDPTKISGRCGRLKCCLRYEYDTYEEHRRELPGVGKLVVTREGQGKVLAQEILARKVLVRFDDDRRILIDEKDVLTVVGGGNAPPPAAPEPDDVVDT
ncbi:MAG: regulatory iron-sulfur-containing complex subunit RicT [Planctomycetaceae bacterium]